MKKLVAIALILVVATSIVWTQGTQEKSATPKSEITVFYYKDTIVDGMNSLAKAFMADNPNVTVKNEMITTEFNTVLASRYAAGQLPELWAAQPGELALNPYIKAGAITDVNDSKVVKQLSDDFKKSITFADGNIYVVPMLTTARGIIYNKDLFKKAGINEFPTTLDAMKVACDKLKAIGVSPFAVAGTEGWSLGSLVYQVGHEIFASADFFTRMNNGTGSHQEVAEVFNFIDIFKNNAQPRFMDTDFMGSVSLYAQEKAAMIFQGPWAADAMMDLAPEVVAKSAMVGVPYTNDPTRNLLYIDYDLYFAVSSKADIGAVDAYLDFIVNGKGRDIFSAEIKSLNAFGISFETHAVNASILEASRKGAIIGDIQYANAPDGWWQNQAIVMQEYLGGQITKSEMLDKLDRDWAASLR
jgi:raffinose/stachyose/melibiose transport system substrate-binding protein